MRHTPRRLTSPTDADPRRALEGGAEVLEAAKLRLAVLVPAIQSWRWRTRVREVADIARAVVRSLPELEPLVARARRRASSEGWGKGGLRAVLDEVHGQLQALHAAVAEREYASLEALVVGTVGLTRKVAIHERETAAAEVLDAEDPLVARLQRFADEVAKVFGRPRGGARTLAFTFEDHERLRPPWRDGEDALAEAWGRIARVDSTGGVERWLRGRAAVAPRQSGRVKLKSGPVALAAAEFWRTHALALRTQYVSEHYAPVRVLEDEESEALKFVLARHADGAVVLGDDARAALLMLAHELMGGAPGRVPLRGGVGRVREWATLADTLPRDDEDWVRLRESLRVVMARTVASVLPPLKRPAAAPARKVEQVLADFFPPSP